MPFRNGKEEEQSRKLFVGGLSLDTTDEDMSEYFKAYGIITDCVVIKDSTTSRSKGFGFVTYETEGEADKCMQERPHTLSNKQVDVKRAVSREESMKPGAHVQVKRVFVGGLKENCNEHVLREMFQQFGTIEDVELPLARDTQRPRGFAFITFNDFDVVDKLVAKRHHVLDGMRCEVKKALSKDEMEKAKVKADQRSQQQRYGGYGSGGGGGMNGGGRGGGRGRGGFGGRGRGRGGGYGGGGGGGSGGEYGGYDDGYQTGYDGYGNDSYSGGGGGYNQGYSDYDDYGGNASSYGPMKSQQYGQRSSGPYGGSYGSSGGGGGGYGGNSGYGGYGGNGGYGSYGGGGGGYGSGGGGGYGGHQGQRGY